jgi:hypothetical protein
MIMSKFNKLNYSRWYLKFINHLNQRIEIVASKLGYNNIMSLLEIEDGIVCVGMRPLDNDIPKQKKRRNVIKVDENGEILWRVADPYEKDDQSEDCFFEYIKTDFKGKVFLVGKNGDEYILNTDNGEINLH